MAYTTATPVGGQLYNPCAGNSAGVLFYEEASGNIDRWGVVSDRFGGRKLRPEMVEDADILRMISASVEGEEKK